MVLAANFQRRQSFSVDSLAISSRVADNDQRDTNSGDPRRLENNIDKDTQHPGNDNDDDIDVVSTGENVLFEEGNDNIANLVRSSSAENGNTNADVSLSSLTPISTSTPKLSPGKRKRPTLTNTPSSSDDLRADDSRSDSRADDSRSDSRADDSRGDDDMGTDESMHSESANGTNEKHSPVLATSSSASSDLETETVSEDEPRSSRKKARTAFHGDQLRVLETRYKTQKYLTAGDRTHMARTLNLKDQQIKTWFQNRRMKEKRYLRDKEQSQCFSLPTGGVEVSQLAALGICAPSGTQQLGSMSPINYHFTNATSPDTGQAAAASTPASTEGNTKHSDIDSDTGQSTNHHAGISSAYTPYRNGLNGLYPATMTDRNWNGATLPLYPSLYTGTQFGLLPQLSVLERSRYPPYFGNSAPV